jgi:hypothetical protein
MDPPLPPLPPSDEDPPRTASPPFEAKPDPVEALPQLHAASKQTLRSKIQIQLRFMYSFP